jgi:hypothetical protein
LCTGLGGEGIELWITYVNEKYTHGASIRGVGIKPWSMCKPAVQVVAPCLSCFAEEMRVCDHLVLVPQTIEDGYLPVSVCVAAAARKSARTPLTLPHSSPPFAALFHL